MNLVTPSDDGTPAHRTDPALGPGGPPYRSLVHVVAVGGADMSDSFPKRRLRQLVREELERTDVKAIVREFLRERPDERDWHGQQRRPDLKVVRQ